MYAKKHGESYYAYEVDSDYESASAKKWMGLLTQYRPELKKDVDRIVKQWNQVVRDYLRNETALRLTVGSTTTQVPVRIVDGLPKPLSGILSRYDEYADLLLNEGIFMDAFVGLNIAQEKFFKLTKFASCNAPSEVELHKTKAWFEEILMEFNALQMESELKKLNEDVLGAYFFRCQRIEIYWASIGIYSVRYGISVEGLCLVALIHELAHAYTHLGKDIDGVTWNTDAFSDTDLYITEGLAQFYTKLLCEKLSARFPAALEAYHNLLKWQPPPYTEHENWLKGHPHLRESVRFAMILCRSRDVTQHDQFMNILQHPRL